MKAIVVCAVMLVAAGVMAQQSLDNLKAYFERAQATNLVIYGQGVDTTMAALKKVGNLDGYLVVEAEDKRFESEKSVPVTAPSGVEAVWSAYQNSQLDLLRKQVGALDVLVKQMTKSNKINEAKEAKLEKDKVAFLLAEIESKIPVVESKARVTNAVAKAPPVGGTKKVYSFDRSELLGASGGTSGKDFPGEGAVLVGLEVSTSYNEAFKATNIGSLQPIYRLPDGSIWTDKFYGQKAADVFKLQAKDGYVVYRVDGYAEGPVHGFKLVFVEMKDINKGLNSMKTYESEFIGDQVGTHKTLGKSGKPVVGIYFNAGAWVDGFGVLTHKIGK